MPYVSFPSCHLCLTHTNSLLCAPLSVQTWEIAFADKRPGGRLPLLQPITPSDFFLCNGRLHFSSVHLSFSVSYVCHYAVVLINLVAVLPCRYCIYTTTSHLFFLIYVLSAAVSSSSLSGRSWMFQPFPTTFSNSNHSCLTFVQQFLLSFFISFCILTIFPMILANSFSCLIYSMHLSTIF